jgi:hypothetical protein
VVTLFSTIRLANSTAPVGEVRSECSEAKRAEYLERASVAERSERVKYRNERAKNLRERVEYL